MILDPGFSQSVINDLCFSNCVKVLGVHHEVTDDFTEAADLYLYVSM